MFRTTSIHCGCALDVEYDPAKPGEYQLVESRLRCAAHEKVSDDEILGVLYGPAGECRTWTSVQNVLRSPEMDLYESDANGQRERRDGVEFDCWFEGDAPNRAMRYALDGVAVNARKRGDFEAAVAAATPAGLSSNTTVRSAEAPSRSRALRYGSGCGLRF